MLELHKPDEKQEAFDELYQAPTIQSDHRHLFGRILPDDHSADWLRPTKANTFIQVPQK